MSIPYCEACSQSCAFCHGTYRRLLAERDRLRVALEKIANPGYWMTGDEATQRARAALAEANASGEDA